MNSQGEARTGAWRHPLTKRLVPLVLAVGTLLTAGVLVLDMSGSGPRTAGSNRVPPQGISVFATGGQTVCQVIPGFPYDAGRVGVLLSAFGRLRPSVEMTFLGSGNRVIARTAAEGGGQGLVLMPIRRLSWAPAATACLRIVSGPKVGVRGYGFPLGPGTVRVDGKPEPGVMSIFYYRSRNETWWQLLPVLDQRFGWGKAPFFGTWTFPFVIGLVIFLWFGVLRFAAGAFR